MADKQPTRRPARRAKPAAPPATPARKDELKTAGWRVTEAGAAVAAFLLSLSIFLLGTFQSLRGAEIVLLPPKHVYLYRDAPRPGADSLVLAVEAGMINTARADYGDVAVQAYAELAGTPAGTARFLYDATVEPVTVPYEEVAAVECPSNARCLGAAGYAPIQPGQIGLRVIERRPELLSVPGGSAHSAWLGFAFGNCQGVPGACEDFSSFDGALQKLRDAPELAFRVTLDFHSDGRKVIRCALENDSAERRRRYLEFLEERGWVTLRCRQELRS